MTAEQRGPSKLLWAEKESGKAGAIHASRCTNETKYHEQRANERSSQGARSHVRPRTQTQQTRTQDTHVFGSQQRSLQLVAVARLAALHYGKSELRLCQLCRSRCWRHKLQLMAIDVCT